MKYAVYIGIIIIIAAVVSFRSDNFKNDEHPENGDVIATSTYNSKEIMVLASDLEVPWDFVFLDDSILITERTGRVLKIRDSGPPKEIFRVSAAKGEGGLLGITLHPDFKINRYLYIYSTRIGDKETVNSVRRYKFVDDRFTDEKIIIDGIPGAIYHDGGRMEFGPDGKLYITTGDATRPSIAQDKKSLGGKILRLNDDGSFPPDNPFKNAVYSMGHRNSQGLAWDSQGNLWNSEHGRSGIQSGLDEINLIRKGENYGWPEIEGDKRKTGMHTPILHSGPDITWAPASLAIKDNKIYFGGLRGEALYTGEISDGEITNLKMHFHKEFGRIRTVRFGPDGFLYLTTSNRDARGTVRPNDDKFLKLDPAGIK